MFLNIFKSKINDHLSYFIVILAFCLVQIWQIQNSIAARNIILWLGAILSLLLILKYKDEIKLTWFKPQILLSLVIFWVALNLFLISPEPNLASSEISSTWLRGFLALVFGTGLGLAIRNCNNFVRVFFYLSIGLGLITHIIIYLNYVQKIQVIPKYEFYSFYITKAPAGFFFLFFLLFLCAATHYLTSNFKKKIDNTNILLLLLLLLFILCFTGFYSLKSLNGFLVALIFLSFLFILNIIKILSSKLSKKYLLFLPIVVFFILIFFLSLYGKDNPKLENIFLDAISGFNLTQYQEWRADPTYPGNNPVDPSGRIIQFSTFYRVASFIYGSSLLLENPLGTGFTYLSYGYYMKKLYPGSIADHTHSGWIDLALGIGFPGLILIFSAIIIIFCSNLRVIRNITNLSNLINLHLCFISVWISGGMSLIWLLFEVGEKEYIEHLYFFLAFATVSAWPVRRLLYLKAT